MKVDHCVSRRTFIGAAGVAAIDATFGRHRRLLAGQQGTPDGDAPPELDASYQFCPAELIEITKPGPIILPDGTSQHAWSRRAYLDLNFEDAAFLPVRSAQALRMKKWDMVHMATPTHYISFLVAWIGYASFCGASVYTRRTRAFVEDTHVRGPYPETEMMRNSSAGRTRFACPRVRMTFEVDGEFRRVRVNWPGFGDVGLSARIDLREPAGHESICATHRVTPRRAYYSHKINCMPATGELRLGDRVVRLDPNGSFGMLDFGRGYYPDKTFWYWATASGRDESGKLIGWNLGHANDPDCPAENAVFYDGRLHKIGPVRCHVPRGDLMKPWTVRSTDGRVDLTFKPEKVRRARLEIGRLHSIGRPAFGSYAGTVKLDDGKVIRVPNVFGLYEWFDQKW